MKAKFDGHCICGARIRAGKTEIEMLDGVAVEPLCAERAQNPGRTPPAYVEDVAGYLIESERIAAAFITARAAKAERKASRTTIAHHPDCDAQIPGNPCTCAYERR